MVRSFFPARLQNAQRTWRPSLNADPPVLHSFSRCRRMLLTHAVLQSYRLSRSILVPALRPRRWCEKYLMKTQNTHNVLFSQNHSLLNIEWAIAFNICTSPGWGTMEFSRGKLLKLRISLGVVLKNMEFFEGEALFFTKFLPIFFRGGNHILLPACRRLLFPLLHSDAPRQIFYGIRQGWIQL